MNDPNQSGSYQAESTHSPPHETVTAPPTFIGRYRVEKILGQGGFGIVYLAFDEQLQRLVAVKVPHRHRVSTAQDAETYLTEARTVASLDHPHIVPVYDVDSTPDYPCIIVSKFIKGQTLAQQIRNDRPPIRVAAEMVAKIAKALHFAHRKGIVHRDVKPSNILIDTIGDPFVVDFGLALKEENIGHGPRNAGTPAYMSPEQARGEGHRVDGRSDIFSLGVIFYELLVGRQPFRADSLGELLEQVASFEPRPPRQYDENIPKELERICLKALAKRASERYTTGHDLAEDLGFYLTEQTTSTQYAVTAERASGSPLLIPCEARPALGAGSVTAVLPALPTSDSQSLRIVPKGLRAFDSHDANFFLELLPGPRDREGLPSSLRFWKTRIEEKDADNTFSVGLIYGPSGCGKSSLVKAGLLPHLAETVIAVDVEATTEETESRLLNGLRKRCPALSLTLCLKETLPALRRGQGIPAGKKVLIVLDQFEQWLHAKKEIHNTDLIQALRQCDGGRVQCIVMVRDDFWMAATRFMRELEVRLVEDQNSAAVDLFDTDHARKVLAAFGRAFGKLPENNAETTREQQEFLTQAVSGLAQEGKVVSVRLALFAEMMKGKPWTPASLKEVGGTEGVGVTFLEETFSAATAPPQHRYHQQAARAVLKTLLPESGADIKGHMRSHAELLEASGYSLRPKDFDDLIHILDIELRLLTPTDPEGAEAVVGQARLPVPGSAQRFYQLTHDYLVPSLRDWLTRKQKETRRGRAELLLADQAAVWTARPDNRQLPSFRQWLSIRLLTPKRTWTPTQRKMMTAASRYHLLWSLTLGLLLALAIGTGCVLWEKGIEQRRETQAAGLVQAVLTADIGKVHGLVDDMAGYRQWTDRLLQEEYLKAAANSPRKLRSSLALLPVDPGQVPYLSERLLEAESHEVGVIREFLTPHKDALLPMLWEVVEKPAKLKETQRLRAAAALAKYDPESNRWAKAGGLVVNDLVLENPVFLGHWREAFNPVKYQLLPRLSEIFRDHQAHHSTERSMATSLLAYYAAEQLPVLADLLMDADERQFVAIFPKFTEHGIQGLPLLNGVIDTKLDFELPSSDPRREILAKRQANAAVALLRMNQPTKVWQMLRHDPTHNPDPRVRSYLIHRLSPLGADARDISKHLNPERDVSIQRALLLSLGEYEEKELSREERKALLPKLQTIYRDETDPGLHSAAEWLIRHWKEEGCLKVLNDKWAKDQTEREKQLDRIRQAFAQGKEKRAPRWYVNSQGQTMVVIPTPGDFVMGSPPTEADRDDSSPQHTRRISRTFALASTPVTKEQFMGVITEFTNHNMRRYPHPTCPMGGVLWSQAAAYCNWLSRKEDIAEDQWCYEIKGDVIKLKANYLSLTGYRLPTEAEMEYAIRAGAVTSRYYGETDELMPKYAWFQNNSKEMTAPVGSLKPNDFGLFDVQGNVFTWCQESYKPYPTPKGNGVVEDLEDSLVVNPLIPRVLRGGSFYNHSSSLRSARRNDSAPTNEDSSYGFRLARTIAP